MNKSSAKRDLQVVVLIIIASILISSIEIISSTAGVIIMYSSIIFGKRAV